MPIQDDEKRWQLRAPCRSTTHRHYEDIWPEANDREEDPERINEVALQEAADTCASCPVRTECYAVAMADEAGIAADNRFGFTAAMTPGQRWSAEKRNAVYCDHCGEVYDPQQVVSGNLRCARCSRKRRVPPIPRHGDNWNRRHTTLARRVVQWLVESTEVGDVIPLPTPQARAFKIRTADMVRVYEALVADGTLEQNGKGYIRRGNPGSHKMWVPRHLAA